MIPSFAFDLSSVSDLSIDSPALAILLDISHQIQIGADFSIDHPQYGAATLPEQSLRSIRNLPPQYQHKYLRGQLRNYLYDLYYSGELLSRTAAAPAPPALEHNTVKGINWSFYQRLHDSNRSTGYWDPDWQVLDALHDCWLVQKQGLSLVIEREQHLSDPAVAPGDWVAIRLPKNQIESGYYIAIGESGGVAADPPNLQVCFNVSAEGVITLMSLLTENLNALQIPFCFKVLSDPIEYGRYNSAVLRLPQSAYDEIQPLLPAIYRETASQFSPHSPAFTKPLAPGLSIAEEPATQEFGMHRCQLIAEGLLTARTQGNETPEARLEAILQCSVAEVNWYHPHLSPNSLDRYLPFS
ncbi:MAG: hypothetical protein IGS50_01335 [Synechococcales cyanobacterium C42_A2020_086]|jgi:hypothetical protein|nr:hypothetical protein [Synechococcales cyanobacterium C42_A2020_086]